MSCEDGICGTGGWAGPLPGDPSNNSVLSAVPAFGGIDVSWTRPTTNPHAVAYVLLHRGNSSDQTGASYVATVSNSVYHDKVSVMVPTTYYYWIQIVSVNGTAGAWIGPAQATAVPMGTSIMEQLTGKIELGLLAPALKTNLSQISTLNTNLLNEVTARQNGQTTLAQAMTDVDNGVAEALTFIHQEINSRTTADSAQAENINLVASTLGGNIAAVTQTMSTDIDGVRGTVNAMWTAKVNVNGLVGGFGLANDGGSVEAGFDVDRFWIGRTGATNVKPFIVDGDTVYMDKARIRDADIGTLKIAGNAVTVPKVDRRSDTVVGAGGELTIENCVVVGEVSVTLTQPGMLYALFTADQKYSNNVRSSLVYLEVAGVVTFVGGVAITTNVAVALSRTMPAGTHLVRALWGGEDSTISLNERNLFVMGAMR